MTSNSPSTQRNSMSVADAKENIPMGHVERMRHEVAAKNKARTKHLSVGVSMLPGDVSTDLVVVLTDIVQKL